jgi:hypothetical protein
MASYTKGRTLIEGVWKQSTEEKFGPKRKEVGGGWRKSHSEELHNLYS